MSKAEFEPKSQPLLKTPQRPVMSALQAERTRKCKVFFFRQSCCVTGSGLIIASLS